MGLEFPTSASCDKCPRRTTFKLVVAKLRPQVEMHVKMPPGWLVSSLPESGDLLITCPSCKPALVSLLPAAPVAPDTEEIVELQDVLDIGDPATDPTMLPAEMRSPSKPKAR